MDTPKTHQLKRFLTDTQRAFLQGGHEPPTDNAAEVMRLRTRQNAVYGWIDMAIAADGFDREDRMAFYNYAAPADASEETETPDGRRIEVRPFDPSPIDRWEWLGIDYCFTRIFEFYYKMLRENGVSESAILDSLTAAIETAEGEYGGRYRNVEATVSIDVSEPVDLDAALERFERDEHSFMDLKALSDAGKLNIELAED